MDAIIEKQLLRTLFPPDLGSATHVWVILDGARNERIHRAMDMCFDDQCCLYAGELPLELKMTAPYLARIEKKDRFTQYILRHGWGDSWGIFFHSAAELDKLRRHFRGFLRVKDEFGRKLIFRYYDPRVLRVFLPTCTAEQLGEIFGPVDQYLIEGSDPKTAIRFARLGMGLERIDVELAPAAGDAGAAGVTSA
jgi:hypothetical protein